MERTGAADVLAGLIVVAVGELHPVIVLGLLYLSMTVSGRETGLERTFEGVSYDPLTHEFQRIATGRVETTEGGISGSLSVGGFDIPLVGSEDASTLKPTWSDGTNTKYVSNNDSEEDRDNSPPVAVQFTDYNHGLAGLVFQPGRAGGRLAFTLADTDLHEDMSWKKTQERPLWWWRRKAWRS